MKSFSLVLATFLVAVFGNHLYQISDVDRILSLPATAAGAPIEERKEPAFDVVATPEMDKVAIAALRALPLNRSRHTENVGYLVTDEFSGEVTASQPKGVEAILHRKIARATFTVPTDKNITGIFHDHLPGTRPGPGAGDAGPVYKGWVSYIKDERGNIFKIEYSRAWKTPESPRSGWRLTSLVGRHLPGQKHWYPGVTFTRYARRPSSSVIR
ncbi:hypothetical protein [Sansalvadorimonas verongulae]|uniref:hypothetical protein n=1 Tax=Sansalvadorimonas verongulae TaxID=2172824 RepID=UPI0012BC3555|nr:hypothetical protein [Sansalvadorimonas verongulae]MTI14883.1 hypothetical protein [Sansalvadorimonas verongulae]